MHFNGILCTINDEYCVKNIALYSSISRVNMLWLHTSHGTHIKLLYKRNQMILPITGCHKYPFQNVHLKCILERTAGVASRESLLQHLLHIMVSIISSIQCSERTGKWAST